MERKKEMLSVSFSLSLSIKESESAGFITIIVCLVGILLSVLETGLCRKYSQINVHKGWGQSAKLGKHSAIWGKLGTALQAYTLNPCTKFPPNLDLVLDYLIIGG